LANFSLHSVRHLALSWLLVRGQFILITYFTCRHSAMLYLCGHGGLLTRGTLQQKIEVCGQQLVSSGGGQQIAAL
jgi:hypothetical protein